jgi:hypothetical protein
VWWRVEAPGGGRVRGRTEASLRVKTALLDDVADQAEGCRVVRADGVVSEMELAFAA